MSGSAASGINILVNIFFISFISYGLKSDVYAS